MKRITLLFVGLLALVLAACGGGGASTAASAAASTAAEESADAEPSVAAEESTDDGGGANPSFEAGAGDLDALLPDEVGGIALEYQSASGEEVVTGEGGAITEEAQAFFDAVGADASQLSSAFGFGIDEQSGDAVTIIAFRVAGANEDQLRAEFARTLETEGSTMTEANVAGKDVLAIDQDSEQGGYLYANGDIVFMVAASSPELAEEALSALP